MNEPTADELLDMGYSSTLRGHDAFVDMRAQWRNDMQALGYRVVVVHCKDPGLSAEPLPVRCWSVFFGTRELGVRDSECIAWGLARKHRSAQQARH